jgi:uncharacterized protein
MKFLSTGAVLLTAAVFAASGIAGNVALPNGPYLIADGSATLEAPPDFVTIKFTLSKTAPTTAEAAQVVDGKTKDVLEVLHSFKIPEKDIRASSVSVSANYDYQGSKQIYVGQQVSRDFKVTLNDLGNYSALMQKLLKANIDSIDNITFDTSHHSEYDNRVMQMAISDAHERGLQMAKTVSATLGNAYALASQDYKSFIGNGFPLQSALYGGVSMLASPAPPPPPPPPGYVVPKSITISYDVTIVYAMSYGKPSR